MKKWILLAAICSLPLQLMAQDDDMYFVPTKENVAKEAENYGMPKKTYYSGSNRSIDDYNGRLSSTVTPIDSAGQEVETEDYQYTRQLSRFDDYSPSQAYWDGYRDGRWNSPWYYGRYGWYSTWYDPSGMHHGMIHGMIRGTILATMAIILHGATVGTAATTIVHGATIVGILLFIIMAVVAIGRQLTTVSTPIVM